MPNIPIVKSTDIYGNLCSPYHTRTVEISGTDMIAISWQEKGHKCVYIYIYTHNSILHREEILRSKDLSPTGGLIYSAYRAPQCTVSTECTPMVCTSLQEHIETSNTYSTDSDSFVSLSKAPSDRSRMVL